MFFLDFSLFRYRIGHSVFSPTWFVAGLFVLIFFSRAAVALDVGILKSSESMPYNLFVEGLQKTIPDANFYIESMEGDFKKGEGILEGMKRRAPDVLIALGPKAAWVSKNETDVPVIFSMLSNPEYYKLGGMTGVKLDYAAETYFSVFNYLIPGADRIGVIYSKKNEAYVSRLKEIARAFDLTIVAKEVSGLKEIQSSLDWLLERVDGLWILQDPVVTAQPQVIKKIIILRALRKKIPIIGINKWSVKNGALFCLFTDYEDVGGQTGAMINRLVRGESLSVESPANAKILFNSNVIDRLSPRVVINIPKDAYFAD